MGCVQGRIPLVRLTKWTIFGLTEFFNELLSGNERKE